MRVCQAPKWGVQRPCRQEGCGQPWGAVCGGLEWGAGAIGQQVPPQEVAGKTQAAPSTAGRSDSTDRKKFKKLGRKLTPEAVDSIRALKT